MKFNRVQILITLFIIVCYIFIFNLEKSLGQQNILFIIADDLGIDYSPNDIYEENNLLDFELSEDQNTNYVFLKEKINSIKNTTSLLHSLSNNKNEFTIKQTDKNSYTFEFANNHLNGELIIYDISGKVLLKQNIKTTIETIYLPQQLHFKIATIKNNGIILSKKFN